MSDDLEKRLRDASSKPERNGLGVGEYWNLCDEAADELARLRAENEALRKHARQCDIDAAEASLKEGADK